MGPPSTRRTCLQDCCFDKRKSEDNIDINEEPGTQFFPKLRDVTLAKEFSTTAMEAMVRGPTCDAGWMATSPLSMRLVVWDWDLSSMHLIYATVGVFSDSTLDIVNCISTSLCSTKYYKRTASISKFDFFKATLAAVI